MVEFLDAVAHLVRHAVHSILRPDHDDAVAYLHPQVAFGKKIHVASTDTRDVDAIDGAEVHLSESLAVHRRLRDEDVLAHHRHVLLLPFHALLRADEDADGLGIVLSTSDEHLVALADDGVAVGDADVSVLQDAAADEVASQELTHLKNRPACEVGVLHHERHAVRRGMRIGSQLLFYLPLLVLQADAAQETKGKGCSDNAQHAKGIGTGIAVGNGRRTRSEDLVAGFGGSTKAGGVGDGSTEHAHHHGKAARIGSRRSSTIVKHKEIQPDAAGHIE